MSIHFDFVGNPICTGCGKVIEGVPGDFSAGIHYVPQKCQQCEPSGWLTISGGSPDIRAGKPSDLNGAGVPSDPVAPLTLDNYQRGYDDGWNRAMKCVAEMIRAGVNIETVRAVAERKGK